MLVNLNNAVLIHNNIIQLLRDEWEREIILKRNEFLIRKNDINTKFYFVKSGSIRIYIEDGKEEHTIRFGYQNSFITAIGSFLSNEPTTFYVQALKETNLYVISKNKLLKCINNDKKNKVLWSDLLEHVILQQVEREIDLITFSPIKRLERLKNRSPQVFQEIPQKYIASYLRMTPETLSRIFKDDLNR